MIYHCVGIILTCFVWLDVHVIVSFESFNRFKWKPCISLASVPLLNGRESHQKHVTAGNWTVWMTICLQIWQVSWLDFVCKIYNYLFSRRLSLIVASSSLFHESCPLFIVLRKFYFLMTNKLPIRISLDSTYISKLIALQNKFVKSQNSKVFKSEIQILVNPWQPTPAVDAE